MNRAEYLRRWSELHGGMDPASNRLVLFWLTVVHRLARPLVRIGASPNAVTTLGLALAGAGRRRPGPGGGGSWLGCWSSSPAWLTTSTARWRS